MNKKPALLSELETANDEMLRAKGRITLAVLEARKAGLSWAEIAEKLYISKQAAQQRYGAYVKQEMESEAAFQARESRASIEDLPLSDPVFDPLFNQPKEPAKPATLVDEDRAGQSVTPSIFLEPKAPALPGDATFEIPAEDRYRGYEPLPAYTNPHQWEEGSWMQDDPRHFLVNDAVLRPQVCPFCRAKSHVYPDGSGTWIYEGCTPTWTDPNYFTKFRDI